jgi:uncharacterized protein YjbJ (UPF0337 family)
VTDDRIAGAAKTYAGKAEDTFGKVVGDTATRAKGAMKQVEGAAQDMYGQAKETAGEAADVVIRAASEAEDYVRDVIEKRPYTVALVALAAGFVLGRMGRRDHY